MVMHKPLSYSMFSPWFFFLDILYQLSVPNETFMNGYTGISDSQTDFFILKKDVSNLKFQNEWINQNFEKGLRFCILKAFVHDIVTAGHYLCLKILLLPDKTEQICHS